MSVPYRPGTPRTGMKTRQAVEHATTSRHVSLSSGPRLPVEVDSGATTRLMALNPTSMLRRAPVLSCVSQLQTSPPCRGGLRCYHASYGSGPRLPVGECSSTAMCLTVLCGSQGTRIKEGTPACFQGVLTWFQGTLVRVIEACRTCEHAVSL
jgi:hypothetical protein